MRLLFLLLHTDTQVCKTRSEASRASVNVLKSWGEVTVQEGLWKSALLGLLWFSGGAVGVFLRKHANQRPEGSSTAWSSVQLSSSRAANTARLKYSHYLLLVSCHIVPHSVYYHKSKTEFISKNNFFPSHPLRSADLCSLLRSGLDAFLILWDHSVVLTGFLLVRVFVSWFS